jgi:hypothetical protein
MKSKNKQTLKKMVMRVNNTLIWFKRDTIECRRLPTNTFGKVKGFREFIEARFNREAWNTPEFREAEELLGGFLFKAVSIEGVDESRKKYKNATFKLTCAEDVVDPDENLKSVLSAAKEFIGGTIIKFNGVKVKVKIIVENDEVETSDRS